jgi:hypothetical protein
VAESLLAAQNANEEELALLEEEMGDMGASPSVPKTHSWRASACLGVPTDSITTTDPRRQFQNLVHMWAENGESSTSVAGSELFQSRFNSKDNTRETVQVGYIAPRSQTQRGETNIGAAAPAANKLAGREPMSTEPIGGELVQPTGFPHRIRANCSYEANPKYPAEISVFQNEILEVDITTTAWWPVKKENGTTGIVPSRYLLSPTREAVTPTEVEYSHRAKAIYSYLANPNDPSKISFSKHEILEVDVKASMWWKSKRENGVTGIVPSNYLLAV